MVQKVTHRMKVLGVEVDFEEKPRNSVHTRVFVCKRCGWEIIVNPIKPALSRILVHGDNCGGREDEDQS